MSSLISGAVFIALGCYAVAAALTLARLLRGPSALDRVLALDFLYALGVLVILVLGIRHADSVSLEAALLVAVVGFVSSAAMAKFVLRGEVIE